MSHDSANDGLGTQTSPRPLQRRALGLWVLLASVGCGDAEGECPSAASCEGDVRLATWWWDETGGQPPFMPPLSGALDSSTGLALSHLPSNGKSEHLASLHAAARGGQAETEPLDAVLLNNGEDVLSLAGCSPGVEGRWLPLEGYMKRGWFSDAYDPDLVDTLSCQGHVYAVPLGIHRVNHVIYNRQLFLDAGISDAEREALDLPGLLDAARRIQDVFDQRGEDSASVFAVPLALPDELSLFFVENVMLAATGVDAYRDYWRGCPGQEQAFSMGLDWVKRLSTFFSRTGDAPLERVTSGKSAMYVIGDWMTATARSTAAAAAAVGSMPFPGTQELWVYTADVFALPLSGDLTKGVAWVHAISQAKAQREFARIKGAIPARLDVEAPEGIYDPRKGGRLLRALPAIGDAALWDVGHALQSWARSSFEDTSALSARAADEYRSRVASYQELRAGSNPPKCQSEAP